MGPMDHVEEVGDDAGGEEPLAALVEVQAPGVAGPLGDVFEGGGRGVIPPDAAVDGRAFLLGRAGLADVGGLGDAVAAVEPAVRAPRQAIDHVVPALPRPAV